MRDRGHLEEAVTLLEDGLQIDEKTGERWFEAELYRHKGQLLLRQGHSEAAEELYHRGVRHTGPERGEGATRRVWLKPVVSIAEIRRE
jgi:hypothetical protein